MNEDTEPRTPRGEFPNDDRLPGTGAYGRPTEREPLARPGGHGADPDDIVIRAFEEHARTERPTQRVSSAPFPLPLEGEDAFEPLLGQHSAELIEAVSTAPIERPGSPAAPAWAGGAPALATEAGSATPVPAFSWDQGQAYPAGTTAAPTFDPPWEDVEAARKLRNARNKTLVREVVETGLLALLVFLAVRASFQNFKVDGSSMFPSLENGQFLIVNKLVYAEVNVEKLSNFIPFLDAGSTPKRYVFHGPERGDIIVLQDPRKPDTDLIKRVIGLPGETLEIVNGVVYINGYLLEEPYIKTPWHSTNPKITIPAGEYFVMGDNRDNSLDSRSSSVGLVPKDLVIGKAMLSYWPKNQFGLAPNESPRVTTQQLTAAKTNGTGKQP